MMAHGGKRVIKDDILEAFEFFFLPMQRTGTFVVIIKGGLFPWPNTFLDRFALPQKNPKLARTCP
jgi:hypothetical protein